jgi:hypothetical protein
MSVGRSSLEAISFNDERGVRGVPDAWVQHVRKGRRGRCFVPECRDEADPSKPQGGEKWFPEIPGASAGAVAPDAVRNGSASRGSKLAS